MVDLLLQHLHLLIIKRQTIERHCHRNAVNYYIPYYHGVKTLYSQTCINSAYQSVFMNSGMRNALGMVYRTVHTIQLNPE